ncbi:hypothetical protein PQX77_010315 [Marasmius sp. AFHP31]|nr:hypothetical protein PQX77_010315 [Marasmius sp. AFHP31]
MEIDAILEKVFNAVKQYTIRRTTFTTSLELLYDGLHYMEIRRGSRFPWIHTLPFYEMYRLYDRGVSINYPSVGLRFLTAGTEE